MAEHPVATIVFNGGGSIPTISRMGSIILARVDSYPYDLSGRYIYVRSCVLTGPTSEQHWIGGVVHCRGEIGAGVGAGVGSN